MRGRRRQSESVKSQKAAVRSKHVRRTVDVAGQKPPSGGQPPVWLKKEGLKVWQRLAPTLRAAKLLTDADAQTFGRYCRNFARWLDMQARLDKNGEIYEIETASGMVRRSDPAFMIADRLERQLLAAEDRFGLNPAERQRIFVARASTGVSGDLFSGIEKGGGDRRPNDPATQPTQPSEPIESPIGLLN